MPERKNNIKKNGYYEGQITVFILLLFMLVVSVFVVQYQSALHFVCRADARRAARMSTDSFLASYQKPLRDRYQILAVDGGFGQKNFQKEVLDSQLLKIFQENMKGSMISGTVGDISLAENPIYTLLIENDWDFFVREISLNRQEAAFDEAVSYILNTWNEKNDAAQITFEQKQNEAENAETSSDIDEESSDLINIQDPRESIMALWNQGILKAACPENFEISKKGISTEDVSFQEVDENVGAWIDFKDNASVGKLFSEWKNILNLDSGVQEFTEELAVQSYIKEVFCCALTTDADSENTPSALNYEIEYLIGGHQSDADNLTTVLWKILAIRCVFNLAYLMTSTEKNEQVMATAATLSTALLIPQFTEVTAFVLKLVWAFAEALSDCRTLLKGGKIPLMKNDTTWYLTWSQMLQLNTAVLDGNDGSDGLDYLTYLQVLTAFTKRDTRYRRMTHIMEKNIRLYSGFENFYMKNCVYGVQAVFECPIGAYGVYNVQTALSY